MATYDADLLEEIFDEGVAYHLPGHNRISGTHHGKGPVMDMLSKAREHYLQHPYTTDVLSRSSSNNHIAIRTLRQANVHGKSVIWTQTTLFFLRGGLVSE